MQRWLLSIHLSLAALTLGACGDGDNGVEDEICVLTGRWVAHEERVASDCDDVQLDERDIVLEIGEVNAPESAELWTFQLTRGREPLESCAGTRSEVSCEVEVTCRGRDASGVISYSLEVELDERDALSGTAIVSAVPDSGTSSCEATFALEGKRETRQSSQRVSHPGDREDM